MTTDTEEYNHYSSAALDQDRRGARSQNISETERWVSLVIGGGLLALGLKQGIRERSDACRHWRCITLPRRNRAVSTV